MSNTKINHLKLFLNINTSFDPGCESMWEYLKEQAQVLDKLAELMKSEEYDGEIESAVKEIKKFNPISYWETEGEY